MIAGRFQTDTAIASTDLAWLLVVLFFVTSVIALRPTSLTSEVASRGGAQGRPVVIELLVDGGVDLLSAGPLAKPPTEESVAAWLGAACDGDPALIVHVGCPDDATHGWCRARLGALMDDAPSCRFLY